jgi:CheY-like chemotaxis protein
MTGSKGVGFPLHDDVMIEGGRSKIILVVEDDEGIRETLKFALELDGYKVSTAANGQEGIELLQTIPKPGLILLDLMMPVMDGWGFIAALEKDMAFSTIPVVVVSAFADKAKTIRAAEIITKPMNFEHLMEVVKKYCG